MPFEKVDAALKVGRTDTTEREIDGLVKKALALYQGSFLDGDTDKSWSISLRERLHGRFLRQLDRLGRYWEQVGQWDRAVDCYLWGLEVDSLVEDFYQRLMVCYRHLGRRAEALAVYRRCCQTFATILGVEPSAATEVLYRKLRQE